MSKRKLAAAELSNQLNQNKSKKKKKNNGKEEVVPKPTEVVKKPKNKQKVLTLSSRGIISKYRHLLNDIRKLLPHSKKEPKLDAKDTLRVINEICELRSCNTCIFFECRRKEDCYLWVSRTPDGPSAKFYLTNVHTQEELKFSGNCLLGSRPLLVFDKKFDEQPHWKILKDLFKQVFATPPGHPASKPFIDHVMSFYILDNRIWFRNYQITENDTENKTKPEAELVEIGPRFIMNPIKIFSGSFTGAPLYTNANFISPTQLRMVAKQKESGKYVNRVITKKEQQERKVESQDLPGDGLEDVFTE